jgi:hypothetical protein
MFSLIIKALVVYRLTKMAYDEEGPFGLAKKARAVVLSKAFLYYGHNNSWLSKGIKCPHCISFWVALAAGKDWLPVAGIVSIFFHLDHYVERYVVALEESIT